MRIDLPMIEFFGRGGRLKPSWYGDCLPSRDFPMLIELYLNGRLDLDRFVSETISLDDVEEAFDRMERGEVLRSVVTIPELRAAVDGLRRARSEWPASGRRGRPARGSAASRRLRCRGASTAAGGVVPTPLRSST